DLNEQLLAACRADEARTLAGRIQPVGEALLIEREHLLPLAEEGFDLVEVSYPTVNSLGCVKVKTNAYSAPLPAGTAVEARLSAAAVEIWHEGRRVARHERCYGRQQEVLDLEHYLDALAHKPGALAGSKPLAQWRALGRWPASYDRFWEGLMARQGRQAGTKAMIALLQVGRAYGHHRLRAAIEEALALGCSDSAAVRYLVTAADRARVPPAALEVGALARFERPLPDVAPYDRLLPAGGPR
ncbi:MAG TPA: IS21 family transposase, partial [Chloroflexota bacterium]|nr:IS21 family transposase [Chloroflexota bacterium]